VTIDGFSVRYGIDAPPCPCEIDRMDLRDQLLRFYSRLGWAVADMRRTIRLAWYRSNKGAWVFILFCLCIIGALGLGMQSILGMKTHKRQEVRQFHTQQLTCLARNIYYEARGEPTAGQYAVAEVTMNRKASRHYPKTVCEVVHQQNWDPIRKRMVGAFSWTEFKSLPEPDGDAWNRAQKIAETVYYEKHIPSLQGALHFHATYVKPDWVKRKKRIAHIGRHVFYE
jgi:N-acetylmuramoyl-L-alanine amidase